MTLRPIHDFELALLDPVLAMTERGVRIDEPTRQAMLADLRAMRDDPASELRGMAQAAVDAMRANRRRKQADISALAPSVTLKKAALIALTGRDDAGKRTKPVLARYLRAKGVVDFNPNSGPQVKTLLYEVLRLPKRFKDERLTTDEEALKSLLPSDESGIVERLLTINKAATMLSILKRIAPSPTTGRIHTSYNPAGTETGRFSSSETFLLPSTNLSNMPKRTAQGEARFNVRRCFVPDEGCVLVEADLSGAEAWVTAALCGDDDLLERLRTPGFDIHKWTASAIFKKAVADVTPRERQLGKVARHALNYGMQWSTFQKNVNAEADLTGVAIDAATAKTIHKAYHALHPQLEQWWRRVQQSLVQSATLTTVFGRRRTFYGRGAGTWLGEAHREAIAFEPQSAVADLLNHGLLRWWRQHDPSVGELRMQIYDSVLLVVPERKARLACSLVRRCLGQELEVNGRRFTIPVDVGVSATNWAEMREAA